MAKAAATTHTAEISALIHAMLVACYSSALAIALPDVVVVNKKYARKPSDDKHVVGQNEDGCKVAKPLDRHEW